MNVLWLINAQMEKNDFKRLKWCLEVAERRWTCLRHSKAKRQAEFFDEPNYKKVGTGNELELPSIAGWMIWPMQDRHGGQAKQAVRLRWVRHQGLRRGNASIGCDQAPTDEHGETSWQIVLIVIKLHKINRQKGVELFAKHFSLVLTAEVSTRKFR